MARKVRRMTDEVQGDSRYVRVLRDPAELAEASARAAEGERRLRDRLQARAARDAWMRDNPGELVSWQLSGGWASAGLQIVPRGDVIARPGATSPPPAA